MEMVNTTIAMVKLIKFLAIYMVNKIVVRQIIKDGNGNMLKYQLIMIYFIFQMLTNIIQQNQMIKYLKLELRLQITQQYQMIKTVIKYSQLLRYLTPNQHAFATNQQKQHQSDPSPPKKLKIKSYSYIPTSLIKTKRDCKLAGLYLQKIGLRCHFNLSPFLTKIKNTNKTLYSMLSLKQHLHRQQKPSLSPSLPLRYLIAILCFTLSILIVIIFFIRYFEQKQALKETQLSQQQYLKATQNLQKIISRLQKIYIYSKKSKLVHQQAHPKTDSQEKQDNSKLIINYRIVLVDKSGKKYLAQPYEGDPNNLLKYIQKMQSKYLVSDKITVIFQKQNVYTFGDALTDCIGFITPFIPLLLTIYIFRSIDPTSFLRTLGRPAKQFKVQAVKDIKTKFKDVAGMQQAKKQITQFVDFLKNNQKYKQIGAKIPKGALLTGPPGTGKTMLARACAGQSGVSFFYISGSQFVQIFVGLGASKVRQLFAKARQNAPSIIFIDEIDAIGKKRQTSRNEQKDSTLNQLLVEMDGFTSQQTVVVLAATNRKQTLDNALTRPGRFDRIVQITLPDVKARQQIFKVHLAPLTIDPNQDINTISKRLAQLSPGFSGADIANLCNEAAIIATRKSHPHIKDIDFQQASQRITAGYKKKNLLTQKTKKRVAYHQAGHAVSSWYLRGGQQLLKLTIVPRSKGALGYAQYLPKTTYIISKQQIIDHVAILLSGITAEIIFFGDISSGGSDDLQKIYKLTRTMVTQYGMGKSTYNITLDQSSYIQKQSIYLSNKMQDQITIILQQARKKSKQILQQNKNIIQTLAQQLILKQTINKDDIQKIMGKRPNFQNNNQSPVIKSSQ